ncbi:MAG: LysM peptidoglycan-binding domain-containing protein [candidate division WOR-3 bacterium]
MKKFVFIALLLTVSIVLVAQYKNHTVVKGDCLWDIAGFYYNDPFLWPVIYEANKDSIADPHWIYPGEVFVIPNVPEEQVVTPPVQEGIVMEVKGTKSKIEEEEMTTTGGGILEEDLGETEETELFSVVQAADYAFTRKAALLAGFITRDVSLEIGTISKLIKILPDLKGSSTVMGDEVEVDKGANDGISDGDIYVIFDWGRGVGLYGKIVRIKGILKIMEAGEDIPNHMKKSRKVTTL